MKRWSIKQEKSMKHRGFLTSLIGCCLLLLSSCKKPTTPAKSQPKPSAALPIGYRELLSWDVPPAPGGQANGVQGIARPFDKQIDEIGIKAEKGSRSAMKKRSLRSGACGNVRELERDVPSANKHDAPWQRVEFQKLITGRQEVLPGNLQSSRLRSCGHNNVSTLQHVIADLDGGRPDKPRTAMES